MNALLASAEQLPPVSVIVPTYNGAARLPRLLKSLRSQSFDQSRLEIIIVDDDSSDETVPIAQLFDCRVIRNGARNIERGKAIGLEAASHELVMFIDDDNALTHSEWLSDAVSALLECPDAVGAQASHFSYSRSDTAVNRWASIFGVGDPLAYYLNRRDHLGTLEREWRICGTILKETANYWLVAFEPNEFPTLGSQGYLTRKSLQQSVTHWPYWLHIDANLELAKSGNNRFIFMKTDVVHEYCTTVRQLLQKLKRNAMLFLAAPQKRSYEWKKSPLHLIVAVIKMLTLVQPTTLAIKYYTRTRDVACFIHPFLCFYVPIMYASEVASHRLKRIVATLSGIGIRTN